MISRSGLCLPQRLVINAIRLKSGLKRVNASDQFGLIPKTGTPQVEKLSNAIFSEQWSQKSRIAAKEKPRGNALNRRTGQNLKEVTQPTTVPDRRWKRLQEQQRMQRLYEKKYNVDPRTASLIIECSKREFNHFEGQRYSLKQDLPLFTTSWTSPKTRDQYFVIRRTQKVPAAVMEPEGREWRYFSYILNPGIMSNISGNLNFAHPTLVQQEVFETFDLPVNIFIAAETGSGKTIAYGAPLLSQLMKEPPKQRSKVLIITANAFLRSQATQMLKDLVEGLPEAPVVAELVDKSPETFDVVTCTLDAAVKLLKGNPGLRNAISAVVIDEADALLASNNVDTISRLFSYVPTWSSADDGPRQGARVIFSSATCSQNLFFDVVDGRCLNFVKSDQLHRILPNVEQKFVRIVYPERMQTLGNVIESEIQAQNSRTLIFCKDNKRVNQVEDYLTGKFGLKVHRLSPRETKPPPESRFLVATDTMSRGLDLQHVNHVINFNFPSTLLEYIHRVGRVGRCNGSKKMSRVTSFVRNEHSIACVAHIEKCVRLGIPLSIDKFNAPDSGSGRSVDGES